MPDERVRVMDAKGHLEQHLAGRDSPRPATGVAHDHTYLLVARSPNPLYFGKFSNRATDVRRSFGSLGQPLDLSKELCRDPWREETHGKTVPENPSSVGNSFVPKA